MEGGKNGKPERRKNLRALREEVGTAGIRYLVQREFANLNNSLVATIRATDPTLVYFVGNTMVAVQ